MAVDNLFLQQHGEDATLGISARYVALVAAIGPLLGWQEFEH